MHTRPQGLRPITLADHEAAAHAALPPATWAYLQSGAADEITLQANSRAWQEIALRPRVLRPLAGGHTRVEVLGRTLAHPILAAPMACQRAIHPHGEAALALACAAQGAGLVISTQASAPLQDIATLFKAEPQRGPLWFQLYWQADRGFTRELIGRAESAGYEALVLTVDAPISGLRDREQRAGWQVPAGVSAVNLQGRTDMPRRTLATGQSALFDDLLHHAPTWDDLQWLRAHTRLPLLLKGITHPDDARLAVEHGAAGLIVSNHGGRTLDTLPATARLLPAVVQATAGEVPVLVDGGLRRGTDVLKAMALGASAVLVGRPLLHGLAHGGALGVAQVIRRLRDELEVAMALSGCRTLAEAGPQLLG